MNKKTGLLSVFALFLFMGMVIAATGTATSQVLDASSPMSGCTEAIQGATVIVYNAGNDYETTTNEDCEWTLEVEAGTYTVLAHIEGFFSKDMQFTIAGGQNRNPQPLWLDPVTVESDFGYLTGYVYFEENGIPVTVEGADVFVTNGFDVASTTQTDADGMYRFNEIPVGTYDLTASKAKYINSETETADVAADQTKEKDLFLKLGKIYGTVTCRRSGEPLEGVAVKIWSESEDVEYNTVTDENGDYEVDALLIKYRLQMTKEGYRLHEIIEAPWFDATSGDTEYNVELIPRKMVISGIVHDQTEAPVNNALVEISEECGEAPVNTDATGKYEFRCWAGTYDVTASKNGYHSNTETVTGVHGEKVTQNIEITYFTNANIVYTVKNTNDELIQGANVELFIEGGELYLTGITNVNGIVRFQNTPTNNYYVVITKDGYNIYQSEVFTLTDKGHVNEEVILTKMGSISGTVRNSATEQGIPSVEVTISHRNGADIITVITDEDGKYSFEPLEEGLYTVSAWKEYYGTKSTNFAVNLNNLNPSRTLDLDPIMTNVGARVEGIDADGTRKVLPNSTVTLRGQGLELINTTDENGEYIFENIPAGYYEQIVTTPEGYTEGSTINVLAEPGTTMIYNIVVYKLGSISGHVTSWADQNVDGAMIRAYNSGTLKGLDTTDGNGDYLVEGLAPTGHTITAIRSGCEPKTYTGVVVNTGQNTVKDFKMLCQPGVLGQVV